MNTRRRFFNTAGPCDPRLHYMVDPLPRIKGVDDLIDESHYFVIHAPRQSGKTTYLYALMHKLNAEGRFTALQVNIQAAASGRNELEAMKIAAHAIRRQAELYLPETEWPEAVGAGQFYDDGLQTYLANWARANPKPIALFIDEADSLMDELFLALLRQLRAGFEARASGGFPQSIALVGLRDVRDYKIRVRPDSASLGTGSPFNIKTTSIFIGGFTEANVNALMDEHTNETGQAFPPEVRAEIFRLSQGQPWLTNALLNQIVRRICENDTTRHITLEMVTLAREQLIERRDTHLDSLIDKLREPPVRRIVNAIINGGAPEMDSLNDDVLYASDLGLVSRSNPVRFANPIYQEIIPRVMGMGFQMSIPTDEADPVWYIKDGRLNMDALLKAFQEFYREHSEAWLEKYDFREIGRQLLLMAFLQRIVNGGGRIEREMAIGNGRCDLWLEYGPDRFVIELKLRRAPRDEDRGLMQTARYASRMGLDHGYLLLFETDAAKPWEERLRWEAREQDGRRITLVGM